MRWLIAFALIVAVVIIGPDFAGRGATPMAIWEAAGTADLRLASFIPVPQLPAPGESKTILRKFYEELGLADEPQPVPELTPAEMCEHLAAAANEREIPAAFFARLIWQESRFDPRAVSPVGAQGVAQFMPKVANAMGLENPFDPRAALPMSAQLLQTLYRTFGNLGLAAAAYNAGPKRVQDWLAKRGPLPDETRNYVQTITGHAPEKWTVASSIELPLDLPRRAPCDGIAGMSRAAGVATVAVRLEDSVVRLLDEAKAKLAKIKMAKAQRALEKARKANAAKIAEAAKAKAKPAAKGVVTAKLQDRVKSETTAVASAR